MKIDMNKMDYAKELITHVEDPDSNLCSLLAELNPHPGIEIVIFRFKDRDVWVPLSKDYEVDWSNEIALNIDNGYYSLEDIRDLLMPITDEERRDINKFIDSSGMDSIFKGIQALYDEFSDDGYNKPDCRSLIKNEIDHI